MNISNLYNFCDNSLICYDTIIYISEYDFWISILSINSNTYKCNLFADEWLYLINYNYPYCGHYNYFVNKYNNIVNELNNDIIYYNTNVISLLTTFSRGSVHGYSGFWYTLITYLNTIDQYKDLDIIMYSDSCKGMISVINFLCNKGIIKNKIIFLEKNKKYKFDSVTYIKNDYHVFNYELENMVPTFIEKYNIIDKTLLCKQDNIGIIKSNMSETPISNNGILNNDIVENFCNKYNIYRIFPKDEIQLINLIYNCKLLILNFGSTFFKNYV
jgi:hypothetical protein